MRTGWMADAACARHGDVDFYEYATNENLDWKLFAPLVAICAECPVLRDCAEFSMREGGIETEGIWAGTTPRQRLGKRRADDPIQAVIDDCMNNYAQALRFISAGEQLGLAVGE